MTTPTVEFYRGPKVGCTFCAYEMEPDGTGAPRPARPATHVLHTERGVREVCETHAARGRWRARDRRVSAVAS